MDSPLICPCCGHPQRQESPDIGVAPAVAYQITDGADPRIARLFVACAHCRSLYLPPESRRGSARNYAEAEVDTFLLQENARRRSASSTADFLNAQVPLKGIHLLEVGCAAGYFLEACRGHGAIPAGIEPCRRTAALASSRLGIDVRACPLEEADFPANSFRAVVMLDVIEHFDDPVAALREAWAWTSPGGYLVLLTPIADSLASRILRHRWWSRLPSHAAMFSRARLLAVLHELGYEVVHARWWGRWLPLGQVAMHLLKAFGAGSSRLARRLPPFPIKVNARDQMLVLARKAPSPREDAPESAGPSARNEPKPTRCQPIP